MIWYVALLVIWYVALLVIWYVARVARPHATLEIDSGVFWGFVFNKNVIAPALSARVLITRAHPTTMSVESLEHIEEEK